MTKEQQYFLHLVRTHLNNEIPEAPTDIDFSELFKVCELQNMTAIAAVELKKLLKDGHISKEQFSPFNQVLGLTIQNYEFKAEGIRLLSKTLSEHNINHLFLKGAAIRDLYPVPEIRTSGDTDVVVNESDLAVTTAILKEAGFQCEISNDIQSVMSYRNEEYEIKSYVDTLNDLCRSYFNDIFGIQAVKTGSHSYILTPFNHLIYVLVHILKHFRSGGAGIRQLCDLDVLLRNSNIDIEKLLNTCAELGISKSTSVLLSLCKKYFDTPITFEDTASEELKVRVENMMLNGGTFGFGIGNIGTVRLTRMMSTSHGNHLISFKAFLNLFSYEKEDLLHRYEYARRHHILLPTAYFSRIFDAVFKRGAQNLRHIKSIFRDKDIASEMSDLLSELEINE